MAARGAETRSLPAKVSPVPPRPSLSPSAAAVLESAAAYADRLALARSWMEPSLVMSSTESNFNHKIGGIPCVAATSRYTAPVHIDVGGTIYTSSLETLTKHPDSRLARMFNGSIPIVLDTLKQHYFIDRDGKSFRHILNFLRTNTLPVSEEFKELDLLLEEARFYDIPPLVKMLESLKKERHRKKQSSNCHSNSNDNHYDDRRTTNYDDKNNDIGFECLALNVSPDLGERITISGERSVVEEVFPEISQALMDARSGVAWNTDSKHVIRFPLNGYCKLNSLQTITRLLNNGFKIMASNGGGVEGQQFSEYLFVRKHFPI
ncbi:BTB/POZ domain-containing protein kctd15-like isoform X1 [Tachypleus tridentatus]|uniref:BTB/POZ domain-containing protein kctd15-like isoform X1 n=2 Tax=Tachypleus tridentatus TaxID=6853 RepID=UPI003FD19784